jgi:hypothetical protein
MRMHRALLAVVLCFAAAPALAQEAMTAETSSLESSSVESSSLEAASLFAPEPAQSAAVAIRGVVSGSPESVNFAGQAKVSSRLAPDPDFFKPRLVLSIDLSGVGGVGAMSGAKYVISGPELVQRSVAQSHTIEITFPFRSSGADPRSGVASFVIDFDVNTGAVTGASGNVSSPNFPR